MHDPWWMQFQEDPAALCAALLAPLVVIVALVAMVHWLGG